MFDTTRFTTRGTRFATDGRPYTDVRPCSSHGMPMVGKSIGTSDFVRDTFAFAA